MTRQIIATDAAPQAIGPYSQAVRHGGLVYTSGQIALDPQTGVMQAASLEAETRQTLSNLSAVLKAAGSSLERVIKTTIYLVDMNDFAEVNNIYASHFSGAPPARATVAVAALPKGARIEIDAIAEAE